MSNGEIKIPIGIRTIDRREYPVHISEIKPEENGDDCNCVCPNCKAPLRARRGKSKHAPHFAHAYQTKCDHSAALESGLHKLAKRIIEKNHSILIPGVNENDSCWFGYNINKSKSESLARTSIGDIRPDAVIEINGGPYVIEPSIGDTRPDAVTETKERPCVIVEVKVTHPVDGTKIKKLEALGFPAFEIDLGDLSKSSLENLEAIENAILRDEHRRKLLCHPIDERAIKYARELSSFRNDKQANRWLKSYLKDCSEFPFYLDIPITGEFVFTCDRRIWQGELFYKYVYKSKSKPDTKFEPPHILEWLYEKGTSDKEQKWRKWLSIEKIVDYQKKLTLPNGQEHEILPCNVIQRYLHYLTLIGFLSSCDYDDLGDFCWYSVAKSGLLDPPNRNAGNILKNILNSVNRFSPDISSIIEKELARYGLTKYVIINPF